MNLTDFFLKNWRLKLLALISAFFFWALIVGNQRKYEEHTFKAVVEVVNLKENFEVQRINPEELRVVLRGYRSAFKKLPESKDLVIRIDLGNTSGGNRFNFFAEDYLKNLPGGMSLISVYPRMIEVEVEEFTSVDLPVQVRFINKLPPGMILKSWKAEPQFVTAVVARSKAKSLRYAQTIEIDLGESYGLDEIEIPLLKSSTIARFVETQTVRVQLEIVKEDEK